MLTGVVLERVMLFWCASSREAQKVFFPTEEKKMVKSSATDIKSLK